MQIKFSKNEMKKNIEFTKKIHSMNHLDGYKIIFDKFLHTKWKRVSDKKMNIEKFLKLMENPRFFVGKLFIDKTHIPIRYAINVVKEEKDSLFEMCCDLTNKNYSEIYRAYKEIYNRDFYNKF